MNWDISADQKLLLVYYAVILTAFLGFWWIHSVMVEYEDDRNSMNYELHRIRKELTELKEVPRENRTHHRKRH